MNWKHRVWQFWNALIAKPDNSDFALVERILPAELRVLFYQMTRDEQAHSIRVCRTLIAEGESEPDLLAAALLHDIGKTTYPLKLWERIWIVLWKMAKSDRNQTNWRVPREEINQHPWWRRALIVAENHAEWGSQILQQYHASPRLIWLVQYHQEENEDRYWDKERIMLEKLKRADDLC